MGGGCRGDGGEMVLKGSKEELGKVEGAWDQASEKG